MLTKLINWTKSFFASEDTRPDPEDQAAYDHAAEIEAAQLKKGFPLQSLRNGAKPSDVVEVKDWPDPPAGYTSWTDVYEGPQGIGYVINYEVLRDGKPFRKAINIGPETHREQDWTEVQQDVTRK